MERGARVQLRRVAFAAAFVSAVASVVLSTLAPPTSARAQPLEWEISATGLGPIRIGSTLDEVQAVLPDGYVIGEEVPIAPDLDGRVISLDGAVQALLPIDDDVVRTIVVLADRYRTAEGIGPGSLVADAEAIYGDATLRWSAADQGRERVVFSRGPAGLSFRTSESVGPQAGIYDGDDTVTDEYEPDSRLTSVWITADSPAAPEPQPTPTAEAQPTSTPEPTPTAEPPPTATPEPEAPDGAEDTDGGSGRDDTTDPSADELPVTGRASLPVGLMALCLLFLGFGVTRAGNRRRPWS